MKRLGLLLVPAALLPFSLGLRAAAAADFPPITADERAITSVPGEPNAPAVVLFKKGEFLLVGYGLQAYSPSSILHVQVRLKILTEEGKSSGEVAIGHTEEQRLKNFRGRTVLPDGRVLPVSSDAKFGRKLSRSKKWYTTAVAFPAVQVGAILDYEYELRFDSFLYLEPWFFSEEIPVRYSEVIFRSAPNVSAQIWSRNPQGTQIQRETTKTTGGFVTRAWAENLPAVPDDLYGPPFNDLAAQMLLLPAAVVFGVEHEPLLESWATTCELIGKSYDQFLHRDGGAAKTAREKAGTGPVRQQAEALYRFVRDEIATGPYIGVVTDPEESLGKVLSQRQGSRAEKALLLQTMLKAVKIDSRLVWAADRSRGTPDPGLPNPHWFDTVLVLIELNGQRIFLDPTDRALGFGQLRPGYDGTTALLYDPKRPQTLVLPETPFDQNLQRAEVDLAVDDKGRLTGTGTLRLTGHRAWAKIDWQEDEAKTLQAWKDWLAASYREFQITDLKAVEAPDEGKVTVTWSMSQREEEVLGDEVSLTPSAPLGPLSQLLVQPVASRRTAVIFDYADREEVELRLRWPAGWKVESTPKPASVTNPTGALAATVELKEADRALVYKRRVDVTDRQLDSAKEYESLRSLFSEVEKSDAQKLLLVHP
jgi:uncharacterized protein DUF3857/uncharacterized protein DUF3858